ncbi:hypothetical protein CA13_43440 [Planctomycetes bacterium CA13]|uniref:Uncharacterized protein n=1 Tax=Novipirellula herctigrandis TaxID=2527986 RepID=A0A5C5Z7S5_9BACT|nr:hypothetical protein CA13_43440 [Planctomycetes bacterium CA13]
MEASSLSAAHLRRLVLLCIVASLLPVGGCRICADCEDLAYPAYGGAWQRTRRDEGRVGSLFDPAGAKNSPLVSRDMPLEPDEIERAKRKDDDFDSPEDDRSRMEEAEEDSDDAADAEQEQRDDSEFREREQKLRDLDLEDIRVIPGEPEPPTMT